MKNQAFIKQLNKVDIKININTCKEYITNNYLCNLRVWSICKQLCNDKTLQITKLMYK